MNWDRIRAFLAIVVIIAIVGAWCYLAFVWGPKQ